MTDYVQHDDEAATRRDREDLAIVAGFAAALDAEFHGVPLALIIAVVLVGWAVAYTVGKIHGRWPR
jgi:hypothetical protein